MCLLNGFSNCLVRRKMYVGQTLSIIFSFLELHADSFYWGGFDYFL